MSSYLSSEMVHATSIAAGGRGVLLIGPSGSGKSDLALRLFDRGFGLVSDDQTLLRRDDSRIVASAPATIAGRMEVRGIGIVEFPALEETPVALAVVLTSDIQRMPDDSRQRTFLGVDIPLFAVDAMMASADIKVALALEMLGLRWP